MGAGMKKEYIKLIVCQGGKERLKQKQRGDERENIVDDNQAGHMEPEFNEEQLLQNSMPFPELPPTPFDKDPIMAHEIV